MDQFTKDEENIVLPVSLVKNFANRKYGGQTEQEALKSFVNDLAGQMETQTTNVPPSQPTETAGLMTSPQNMETV